MSGSKNDLYKETFPESFSIKYKAYCPEKRAFHMHDQLEIVLSLCDNLRCKFEDHISDIPKYGFVIFDSHTLHHMIARDDNGSFERYVLYFDSDFVSGFSDAKINLLRCFLKSSISHNCIVPVNEEYVPLILNQLEQLDKCKKRECVFESDENYCQTHEKFLLSEFLLMLNRLYDMVYSDEPSSRLANSHSFTVYSICDYVKMHITENPSIEAIADHFNISKTQIFYIFKEVTGQTLGEYIANFKITLAKDYLVNSDRSIDEISFLLGYSTVSSFSRRFKASTSYSPLQYRKIVS